MTAPPDHHAAWRDLDLNPTHWAIETLIMLRKALVRLWGRDVMLYTGGVSFFALLAVFPGIAILIGLYSLLADPSHAIHRAQMVAQLLPPGAQDLFVNELTRLAHVPGGAISAQSSVALVVGVYAAHRGFKALLAGLSFIHDEDKPRGFFSFNFMALIVLVAAIGLMIFVSGVFFTLKLAAFMLNVRPLAGASWFYSEWAWASFGLTLGLSLVYRFAMSREPVAWRASIVGGAAAAVLSLVASWLCAFYVQQIAHLGVTYGSVSAVVVFLIWLSWSVNAIFFGGALATELEIVLRRQPTLLVTDQRGEAPIAVSKPES
ncbi:MAG: ribonuclease [Caulobacter sp.]|nr:ribonuclease [Caulobacter sp.]